MKLCIDVAAMLMFLTCVPQQRPAASGYRPHQSSSIHRIGPVRDKVTRAVSCDRRRLMNFEQFLQEDLQDPETTVLTS